MEKQLMELRVGGEQTQAVTQVSELGMWEESGPALFSQRAGL